MSAAVEHERFILTANRLRKDIPILIRIRSKGNPAFSLGGGF